MLSVLSCAAWMMQERGAEPRRRVNGKKRTEQPHRDVQGPKANPNHALRRVLLNHGPGAPSPGDPVHTKGVVVVDEHGALVLILFMSANQTSTNVNARVEAFSTIVSSSGTLWPGMGAFRWNDAQRAAKAKLEAAIGDAAAAGDDEARETASKETIKRFLAEIKKCSANTTTTTEQPQEEEEEVRSVALEAIAQARLGLGPPPSLPPAPRRQDSRSRCCSGRVAQLGRWRTRGSSLTTTTSSRTLLQRVRKSCQGNLRRSDEGRAQGVHASPRAFRDIRVAHNTFSERERGKLCGQLCWASRAPLLVRRAPRRKTFLRQVSSSGLAAVFRS